MALSPQEVIKCLKEKQASLENSNSNSINGEEYEEWIRQQRFRNEEKVDKFKKI